ncbi:hypothetical protein DD238_001368 [Peronospora effusa]|uniref:Uncharacterized protein n=1 Tax=Peronospora effusa TaxID=542832 RepID=A0A3M6VS00_9STRA|nr:hypothetical protein DD238_001368 [Peronospora effusa]
MTVKIEGPVLTGSPVTFIETRESDLGLTTLRPYMTAQRVVAVVAGSNQIEPYAHKVRRGLPAARAVVSDGAACGASQVYGRKYLPIFVSMRSFLLM